MKRKNKNASNRSNTQNTPQKQPPWSIWADQKDWKDFRLSRPTVKRLLLNNLPFILLIFLLSFVLYGNGLSGDFLIADDIPGLVQNPTITSFDKAWETGKINIIVDSALYQAGKGTPDIFHLRSVFLHATNTLLVFILASLLFNRTIALITTFLFLAHPINTEAVTWISAWIYLALTFFTLCIIILYILYKKTANKIYMGGAIALLAIYIVFFTDNWVFTIPVILVILDQTLIEKRLNLTELKRYAPLLGLGIAHAVFLFSTALGERIDNLKNLYYNDISKATPFVQRVPYTAFYTWKQYLFPKDLTIYHEGYIISPELFNIMTITTIGIIGLIVYLYFKFRPLSGLMVLMWVSILFSFSPIPVAWLMADRYLYRGTIFFSMLVAIILYVLEKKYKLSNFIKIGAGSLFLAFSIRTIDRNMDWTSDKNLWTSTLQVAPYSARVYNNLGDVYFKEGNYQKAIEYFQIALQLKPDFADVVHNLGYTYMELGNIDLARQYLIKSYEMNPYLYQSLYKLGFLEYKVGNLELSQQYFAKSLEVNPQFEPSIKALEVINGLILQQNSDKKTVQ